MTVSMLPPDAPLSRRLSWATTRLLVLLAIVAIAALTARHFLAADRDEARGRANAAQAQQQELELQTANVRKQLGALQSAGGKNKLDLVKSMLDSRMDWKKTIMAVIDSSFPGITISTLSATNPTTKASVDPNTGQPTTSSGVTSPDMTLTGGADSREQLQRFMSRLREHPDVITGVNLQVANTTGEGDDTTQTWTIGLTLKSPKPMPAPTNPDGTPATTPTA